MSEEVREISEVERRLFAQLTWFAPDTELAGRSCRPLSLGSEAALRLMGIGLFEESAEVEAERTPEELKREEAEIAVYLWLHTEEIPLIERALWSGAWREVFEGWLADEEPVSAAAIVEFRTMRERVLACLRASRYSVINRPRSEHDKTPSEVRGPGMMAWRVSLLGRWTGWSRERILWELPLAEAWQRLHAAEFAEGAWTKAWSGPAAPDATRADFEEFGLGIEDEGEEIDPGAGA